MQERWESACETGGEGQDFPFMTKEKQDGPTYEEAFGKLEAIVARLEEEEPPLDELVRDYEEGMKLLKVCHARLNEAALRIEKVRNDEELSLEPFGGDGEEEGRGES